MAIPEFDDEGFLPEGIHPCSLDELIARFGRFQKSDQRFRLGVKLTALLGELRTVGLAKTLFVDGSFVTAADEPNDIDLVLVLPEQYDLDATLRPFEYNALSKRMVRKRFAFDMLVARENTPELDQYVDFFQQIRGVTHRRKGILKVQP